MDEQQVAEVPQEASESLVLLEGFRDLVGERYGYFLGRKIKAKQMNEETAEERKAVSDIRKTISESIPDWIENANVKEYNAQKEALKDADAERKKVQAPFRKEIEPLAKAVKYMDSTAIPDALKELGAEPTPRFSLSDYVKEAIAAQ
ncbi:unnamed protein product [marine sediment metagenome]|uniref:Uncharacterized protein n=2 Tax=marine sediment metagenome TaxID=412755 RepID=X1GJA4_9ZZZZ